MRLGETVCVMSPLRLNKIIFLAPLADIFACFLQKTKHNILSYFTCTVNAS